MWFITEVFGKIVWVDILSILIFYKILKNTVKIGEIAKNSREI